MDRTNLSILSNASRTEIHLDPYPHIVIKNALDKTLYEQLADEFPCPSVVLNGREKKDTWYDYPACHALNNENISPLWKDFLAYHVSNNFYQDVISLLGDLISAKHPIIEQHHQKSLEDLKTAMRYPEREHNSYNLQTDVSLECQFYINYSEQERVVRGPHVDRPTELYAALLYFRDSEDNSTGSDLQICKAKNSETMYSSEKGIKADALPMEIDMEKVDIHSTIHYEPNTLVLFLNSAESIHAVSPRSATDIPRRHVNFTADLFNLPEDGLFRVEHNPRNATKQWLEKQPVIWRLANIFN